MNREIHEINDLLNHLVDDKRLPEKTTVVSEDSKQRVDRIVAQMNQEQAASVQVVPKPVYDKPPKRKKIIRKPEPVSHFSNTPSQDPVVRMHDRLLQDAMPPPDSERKPNRIMETSRQSNSKKKAKSKKTAYAQPKTAKKQFKIEIKEELPPDIPRDTSVADKLKQKKLEETLAAVPPKTLEQIRQEKAHKKAAEIREYMKQQRESAEQQAIEQQQAAMSASEPEEEIPAWEDKLSEFAEMATVDEIIIFDDADIETPVLSDMPDIPKASEQDSDLLAMQKQLQEEITAEAEQENTSAELETENEVSAVSSAAKPETETEIQAQSEQTSHFFEKLSVFMQSLFLEDPDDDDDEEEPAFEFLHFSQRSQERKEKKEKEKKSRKELFKKQKPIVSAEDLEPVELPPDNVTEILIDESEYKLANESVPDLSFEPIATLETVEKPKKKKAAPEHAENKISSVENASRSENVQIVAEQKHVKVKVKRKSFVSQKVKS